MYVKPAKRPDHLKGPGDPDHLIVRDPVSGQIMPPEGRHVGDFDYHWHQRLAQGDIELAEPPAEPEEPAAAPATAPATAA
jgi:hypothetical protein